MNKKAPIYSYPAESNQPDGNWKAIYLAMLKNCSNEELFHAENKEGPWDDLSPDSWDGEYTAEGSWKAGEVENEIRRRLGVPERENEH